MLKKTFSVMMRVAALIAALAFVVQLGFPSYVQAQAQEPAALDPDGGNSLHAQSLMPNLNRRLILPVMARDYDPAYVSPFGVTMYTGVNDPAGLQEMKAAGAKSMTAFLFWAAIQPTRDGPLNWSGFDATAQNAQAAGMSPFVLFTTNPAWAAQYPGGPVYNMQDLVNFVTAMAQRYNCDGVNDAPGHPCVHYWSFYAEPDNGDVRRAPTGKGFWGHNGAGYAAMLAAISPAIHRVDPKAKVMIGGLAYDWFEDVGGPFVRSFLADTLTALQKYPGGPTAYLDAVAFHYYPVSQSWPTIREKALEIRGIMASHGAGSLPVLVPETGYWSSPKQGSSEAGQAYRLIQTYVQALSLDLKLISWYKVFDDVVASSPQDVALDQTAGLLRLDGSFKPSYYAYRTLARELAAARYLGPYQPGGAEGYVFATPSGARKIVLWSNAGSLRVALPYKHLRVVTATGDATYDITDNQHQPGAPGDLDGGVANQITLQLDNQPLFVEPR